MEQIELNVTKREPGGKSLARQLRREGLVPAIIYGKGYDAQPVSVDARELQRLFAEGVHGTSLLRLHFDGKATRTSPLVMIKEVQRNPITGQLLNVDFHKISLKERVSAQVPVILTGESPAIRQGGILEQILREVEVECLPTEIPDHIEIDTSGLEMGHTIHVSDLGLPEAVTLVTSVEDVVAVMSAPKAVEEPAPAAEGVEGEVAEEEEEEVKEPEVLAQKREREEEAEEAEPERGRGRQKER